MKGDKSKNFFSSKWPVNNRARGLIFFYHDPDTRRLRLPTIRSFRQALPIRATPNFQRGHTRLFKTAKSSISPNA